MFVAVSILVGRGRLDTREAALGLMAVVSLLHPFLASLGMLLPVGPAVIGTRLLILCGSGIATSISVERLERQLARHDRRGVVIFRYHIPLVASVVLGVGAVGLALGIGAALYGPPVFVFPMYIVGAQNAWDLLTGQTLGHIPPT